MGVIRDYLLGPRPERPERCGRGEHTGPEEFCATCRRKVGKPVTLRSSEVGSFASNSTLWFILGGFLIGQDLVSDDSLILSFFNATYSSTNDSGENIEVPLFIIIFVLAALLIPIVFSIWRSQQQGGFPLLWTTILSLGLIALTSWLLRLPWRYDVSRSIVEYIFLFAFMMCLCCGVIGCWRLLNRFVEKLNDNR